MTLFFNLERLEEHSDKDPVKLVKLLEYHWSKALPSSRQKYKPVKNLTGSSFLLHPAPLFTNEHPAIFVAQYIKLAGLRDYFLYKQFGQVCLDTSYFPDLNLEMLKQNPLLQLTNQQISLKYEELYYGFKVRRHQGQGTKEVS